jgi:hypothetical protein
MKPAEIATAVVSIPVIAAFLVSAMTVRAEPVIPAPVATEVPQAGPVSIADEIVIEATRNVANRSS